MCSASFRWKVTLSNKDPFFKRKVSNMQKTLGGLAVLWLCLVCSIASAQQIGFEAAKDRLTVTVDDRPLAVYVFADPEIPRPYFAHVHAPTGKQVTRNHPPIEGTDATDHATMHPGLWLAFGDLDGVDYWRNKGQIVHRRFLAPPIGGRGQGSFTEEKEYLRPDGSVVCTELFQCTFSVQADAYWIAWDSTFSGVQPFYFGDQEEMGLGVRLATSLSELNGGSLRDSLGRTGAKDIWSQAAQWCDYSGTLDGERLGVTVMAHPDNFRPSWWHARNYGFMAANPFGRQAMKKGDQSRIEVRPNEPFRLRYGVWIHSGSVPGITHIEQAYTRYLVLAGN